jgi:hypothetical protein
MAGIVVMGPMELGEAPNAAFALRADGTEQIR